MGRKSLPYEEELYQWLQDRDNAAAYLTAAIEDGDREGFLLALRNVAQARGGDGGGCREGAPWQGKSLQDAFAARQSGIQECHRTAPFARVEVDGRA
jgi:hypothetical protein